MILTCFSKFLIRSSAKIELGRGRATMRSDGKVWEDEEIVRGAAQERRRKNQHIFIIYIYIYIYIYTHVQLREWSTYQKYNKQILQILYISIYPSFVLYIYIFLYIFIQIFTPIITHELRASAWLRRSILVGHILGREQSCLRAIFGVRNLGCAQLWLRTINTNAHTCGCAQLWLRTIVVCKVDFESL